MADRSFRIHEDSLTDRFLKSRAKVRIFGGGYANGKTASSCILALQLAQSYPGSNGLIARSTYPKLNDTIRKEFKKWCPKHWIKSFPQSQNASNTCTLTNGTEINFRYIAQQGKGSGESTTSNLLSATYDWIIVDQMEDPEITEKDFYDLLGRLRGMTPYIGDDDTMPNSGPRWLVVTVNPTRNWLYRVLVKPLHDYMRTGIRTDELMWDDDSNCPMIELFEGSTYENKDNLEPDFIKTLESTYKGQMRDRFLLGKWAAYEGLIYWMYDDTQHRVSHDSMLQYYYSLIDNGYKPTILEAYDHGLAVPACYLFGFVDHVGNVLILDGFYEKEQPIELSIARVKLIREQYMDGSITQLDYDGAILADPAIFKRSTGDKKTVGISTSDIFWDNGKGLRMVRGNNDIMNGIVKIQGYLLPQKLHKNPFTGDYPASYLYISDKLDFVSNEFNDYYWRKRPNGALEDVPQDTNDHAMDTIKYMLSRRPRVASIASEHTRVIPSWMMWSEVTQAERPKAHRYG